MRTQSAAVAPTVNGSTADADAPLESAEIGMASGSSIARGGTSEVAVMDVGGMTCAVCVGIVQKILNGYPGVTSTEVSLTLERATVTYDPSLATPEQFVECIEDAGYLASIHAVDEQGDVELEDPEIKASKLRSAISDARKVFLVSLVFSIPVLVVAMLIRDNGSDIGNVFFTELVPGLTVQALVTWILATPVQFGCGARFYKTAAKDFRNHAMGMNFLVAGGTSAAYIYSVVLLVLAVSRAQSAPAMLFFDTSAILMTFMLLGKLLEQLARGKASNAVGKLLDLRAASAVLVSDWPTCALSGESDVDASSLVVGDVVKVIRGAKVPADGVVVRGNAAVDESMVTGESMPVFKEEGSEVIGATVCSEGLLYAKVTRIGKASALQQIIRLVEQAQGSKAPIQEFGDRVASVFVPAVACLSLLTLTVWLALTLTGVVPERWYRDQPNSPGPALFSFMFSLAVLVIACPCAVGLAAPTAILVGTGVAARRGVLIKGGAVLQRMSELKRVVFDKTGTLTVGKPRVTEVAHVESEGLRNAILAQEKESTTDGGGERRSSAKYSEEVLRLVASAERGSEHPLAKAIVEFHTLTTEAAATESGERGRDDEGLGLEMPEDGSTTAVSGKGLSCTVRGLKVSVGSPGYIEKVTGTVPGPLAGLVIARLESSGRTVVVASVEGHICCLFGLVDTVRPEAKGIVAELDKQGLEVWMVTGDNLRVAREVARRVGIPTDRVCAEVLPAEKAEKIKELQQRSIKPSGRWDRRGISLAESDIERQDLEAPLLPRDETLETGVKEHRQGVAMIGDGINDAPALAMADVGIAIGGGTDVAVESADLVLMGSSMWDVLTALDLCRTILTRIRINYFWALAYNTIMLPVAAGVLFPALKVTLPPEVAGGAMAMSSVSVIMSSLALRLYRPPKGARDANAAKEAATAAAATSSVPTSGAQKGPREVEPVTMWRVDLNCLCSCCREGAKSELAAVAAVGEGGGGVRRRQTEEGRIATHSLVSCCPGAVRSAPAPSSPSATNSVSSIAVEEEASSGNLPNSSGNQSNGTLEGIAGGCGVPGAGGESLAGCACLCSFCQCVRAGVP